jgi:hypothetical protein
MDAPKKVHDWVRSELFDWECLKSMEGSFHFARAQLKLEHY